MNLERSTVLDTLRVCANYLIVVMHAWAGQQYCLKGTWEWAFWDFICNSFSAIALPALFFLSGYLLMRNFEPSMFVMKLKRRTKRLLIPFFVWNVSLLLFYLIVARYVPRLNQRVSGFGLNTLSGAFEKVCGLVSIPLDAPTWFLRTIFVYAVFAPLFYYGLRVRRGAGIYLMVGLWWWLSTQCGLGDVLQYSYPVYSISCFVLGAHFAIKGLSPVKVFQSQRWWLVFGLWGIALYHYYRVTWHWTYSPLRDCAFIIMLPVLFGLSGMLDRLMLRLPGHDFIKRSSFFVYVGHFFFCSILLHLIAPRLDGLLFTGKLTILILFFCVLGLPLTLLAYWLGRRIFRKAFGIWDGSL